MCLRAYVRMCVHAPVCPFRALKLPRPSRVISGNESQGMILEKTRKEKMETDSCPLSFQPARHPDSRVRGGVRENGGGDKLRERPESLCFV